MSDAIELRDLTRCYVSEAETVWAVRDVNVSFKTGSFVCLLGASGSGKSTLLNLIAGLDSPTSGVVKVGDQVVTSMNDREQSNLRLNTVGVVFQDNNLIPELTALENVALPLQAAGRSTPDADRLATCALDDCDIGDLAERLPEKMSGGQRQRVGIARAIAGNRELLLADEPTGALDQGNTRLLFELVRQLCNAGRTAIVATHDHTCKDYADVVVEITDGVVALRT